MARLGRSQPIQARILRRNSTSAPTGGSITLGTATTATSAVQSVVVNKPASVVEGTLMLATHAVEWDSYANMSAPAGWTLLPDASHDNGGTTGGHVKTYTKIATNSEPSTYTFTIGADNTESVLSILPINGAESTPTFVIAKTTNATDSPPSVSATTADDLLIVMAMNTHQGNFTGSWIQPVGMTEVVDISSPGGWISMGAAVYNPVGASGPTGIKDFTFVGGTPRASDPVQFTIAVKPLATGPSTQTITPTATGSSEVFGTTAVTTIISSAATAIATAEVVSSPTATVIPPAQGITASGIATAEAVGSPTIASVVTSTATAIASAEAVGSPTRTSVITSTASGIATSEAVGSPVAGAVVTSTATAISTAEAFGSPTRTSVITSSPTAIATSEAFGTTVISTTTLSTTLSPTAISTAEAFGTTVCTSVITSSPTAITTAEAFGTVVRTSVITSSPTAIATSETFGTTVRTSVITSSPAAIATSETFGTAVCTSVMTLSATAIATAQAFGTLSLAAKITLSPTAIASGLAFGTTWLQGDINLFPPQPAGIIYDTPTTSALQYAVPGGMVIAGRTNYNTQDFQDVSAAGGTVLIYLDAIIDNTIGRYHDKLINASEFGAAVPRWPGEPQANSSGYLNDFRVGGILQAKLEGVLRLMVQENPHMGGFFMDDLGSRSYFPNFNWSTWGTTYQQAYRDGAIALMQTVNAVCEDYGLMVIVNGTWNAGTLAAVGGGYPTMGTHGCSLADGGFVEHHDGEISYWGPYAASTQWGSATSLDSPPVMWAEMLTTAGRTEFVNNGNYAFVSVQGTGEWSSGYESAPTPWGSIHYTGLPSEVTYPPAQGITATGISTAQAVGAPSLTAPVTLTPTAQATGQAFGTTVIGQASATQTLTPSGIASAAAVGSVVVAAVINLSVTAITSAEAHGTSTITVVIQPRAPTGIGSLEAFGQPTIVSTPTLSPQAIASLQALGSPTLSSGINVVAQAFADATAVSNPSITTTVAVVVTGLGTGAVFGSPSIALVARTLSPSGVSTVETFGTVTLGGSTVILVVGIESEEAVGAALINGAKAFIGWGIPIGINQAVDKVVSTIGIATRQAFGFPQIVGKASTTAAAIASSEAFGAVAIGQAELPITGIPVNIPFDLGGIATTVTASGFADSSAVGSPTIGNGAPPAEVDPTSELAANVPFALNPPQAVSSIVPTGIITRQAFGTSTITLGPPPGGGGGGDSLFLGHKPGKIFLGWSTLHDDALAEAQLNTQTPLLGSDPNYANLLGARRLYNKVTAEISRADANNRILWISAKPDDFGAAGSVAGWPAIANGSRDASIVSYFTSLVARNKLTVFTFHHEPIGDANFTTDPVNYCNAFRRIIQVVNAEFGNHRILFCPNYEENRLRNTSGGALDWADWLPNDLLPGRSATCWDFISFDAYQYNANTSTNVRSGVEFSHRWWRIDELFTGDFRPTGTSAMPWMTFEPGVDLVYGIGEATPRPGAFYWYENNGPGAERSNMTGAKYMRDMYDYIFDVDNIDKFWIICYFNSIGADLTYNDERLWPGTNTWGGKTPNHPSLVNQTGDTEITLNVYREKLRSGNTVKLSSTGLPS